jgi:hypothetical protein
MGHRDDAVRTLEQALKAMPAANSGPAVGLRRQVETDLATFRSGK